MPLFVYAQVDEGDTAGFISVYVNGEERERLWLTYSHSVERDESILENSTETAIRRLKQMIWGIFPLER